MGGGKRPTTGGGRRPTTTGGVGRITNRELKETLGRRPQMLHVKVYYLIIGRAGCKLATILMKLNGTQLFKLERSYARDYGQGNPYATGGDFNLYKMRDDILKRFHKSVANVLIDKLLQKKNPMPQRVTKQQAKQQAAASTWPIKDRELSKKRLAQPSSWPQQYRSSKKSFDNLLHNKIQGWGEWVLENYDFLFDKNNPATRHFRISFDWPKQKDRPTSLNDLTHYGDFILFSNVGNQFDQVSVRLNQMGKSAFYSKSASKMASYLKRLFQLQEVFMKTKGKTSQTLLAGLQERIWKVKQHDLQ